MLRRIEGFEQDDAGDWIAALTRSHTTRRGVWGRIHVLEGRLEYRIRAPFDTREVVEAGAAATVLPQVAHEVEPLGGVRFFVEFLRGT